MKEFNTDVLIVGSGLVGLVAAHCLSSLNYKVTLVDKKDLINTKKHFNDTRTVAVSEGSKCFLENLSLWGFLKKHAEPIKTILIVDIIGVTLFFEKEEKNKHKDATEIITRFEDMKPRKNLQTISSSDNNKIPL